MGEANYYFDPFPVPDPTEKDKRDLAVIFAAAAVLVLAFLLVSAAAFWASRHPEAFMRIPAAP